MKLGESFFAFLVLLVLGAAVLLLSCKKENTKPTTIPKITISNVTKPEGNTIEEFVFKVNMDKEVKEVVKIYFETQEGSAKKEIDFVHSFGEIQINPGETFTSIPIQILGDTLLEGDEQFEVLISEISESNIINDRGIGTIQNDDTFLAISDTGYITPDSYIGYSLVWADEFIEENIDLKSWTFEIGGNGWGNNELEYYTDSGKNAFQERGYLIIEAKKEKSGNREFTSSRLITKGKKEFKYGRIDIRAKLPRGNGLWPALWMLGSSFDQTGWPACGEIDIMEFIGREPDKIHGTAHWGSEGSGNSISKGGSYHSSDAKFSEEFHVFSITWEEDKIKWLLNDQNYFSLSKTEIGETYRFNAPFFFIFNVAVGGNWPGPPDESTNWPQRMIVDYIRVFQPN